MRDLYITLGQGDEARTAYAAALAIHERLAGIHIVNNLVNMAWYTEDDARALLERAASILRTLDAEGRLAPADRGKDPIRPRSRHSSPQFVPPDPRLSRVAWQPRGSGSGAKTNS